MRSSRAFRARIVRVTWLFAPLSRIAPALTRILDDGIDHRTRTHHASCKSSLCHRAAPADSSPSMAAAASKSTAYRLTAKAPRRWLPQPCASQEAVVPDAGAASELPSVSRVWQPLDRRRAPPRRRRGDRRDLRLLRCSACAGLVLAGSEQPSALHVTGNGDAGLISSRQIIERTSSMPGTCIRWSVRKLLRLLRSCATTFSR